MVGFQREPNHQFISSILWTIHHLLTIATASISKIKFLKRKKKRKKLWKMLVYHHNRNPIKGPYE